MGDKRKQHNAAFKARMALAAVKGENQFQVERDFVANGPGLSSRCGAQR